MNFTLKCRVWQRTAPLSGSIEHDVGIPRNILHVSRSATFSHKNRIYSVSFSIFQAHWVNNWTTSFICYRDSPTRFSRFSTSSFVHNLNLPVPLTSGLNYFRFCLRIWWAIWIVSPKIWLPWVSYPGESVSPGYHTPASQSPRGIIPRQVSLPGVSYPGESISPRYHTPASQSPRGIIPRRVNKKSAKTWLPGIRYPGESISPGYHNPCESVFWH